MYSIVHHSKYRPVYYYNVNKFKTCLVKNFILQLLLDRMLTNIQYCVVHRRCSVMHGNQLTQHLGSGIILFLVITILLNVNTTPLQHLFPTYLLTLMLYNSSFTC